MISTSPSAFWLSTLLISIFPTANVTEIAGVHLSQQLKKVEFPQRVPANESPRLPMRQLMRHLRGAPAALLATMPSYVTICPTEANITL